MSYSNFVPPVGLHFEKRRIYPAAQSEKVIERTRVEIVLDVTTAFRQGFMREVFASRGTAGDTDFMTLLFILQHARPLLGEDLQRLMALGLACPADEGRLFARVTDVGLADEMGKDRRTVAASTDRLEAHGLLQVLKVEPRSFRDSKGQYAGSKLYLLRADLRAKTTPAEREQPMYMAEPELSESAVQAVYTATSQDAAAHVQPLNSAEIHRVQPMPTKVKPDLLEEEDEGERATQFGEVWSLFAQHKGMSGYQPTEKEVSHLTKLFADGYTLQDIRQAMAEGFTRKNPPNNFALVARIARDNRPNAARKPESTPEDVTVPPETAPEVVAPEPEPEPHEPETPEVNPYQVWWFYAQAKDVADYEPTPAEQRHLARLIADGYDFDAICDGIQDAFSRPNLPQSFALVAQIVRDTLRASEIPAELRQHTDLLARSGYAVTAGTLTSMTDLLRLYPPDVLQAALQEAVLYRVSDPLAYARETLCD